MTTTTLSTPDFAAHPAHEGLFARMLRLWIEHHQRIAEYGLGSF